MFWRCWYGAVAPIFFNGYVGGGLEASWRSSIYINTIADVDRHIFYHRRDLSMGLMAELIMPRNEARVKRYKCVNINSSCVELPDSLGTGIGATWKP